MDDMLIFCTNDTFLDNTRTVFQQFCERIVTLNTEKLIIGFDTIPFVGQDINAGGGYQHVDKMIESPIAVYKLNSL